MKNDLQEGQESPLLVIAPETRLRAFSYTFSVSDYGWNQALAKAPVIIHSQQILSCTKVFAWGKSHYFLLFSGPLLSRVDVSELPKNAQLTITEKPFLSFQFDCLLQSWRSGLASLAAFYWTLGMLPIGVGYFLVARSFSLPESEYRSNLKLLFLLYSFGFPMAYYYFARMRISTAWDLRSLQFQSALILSVAMTWLGKVFF